MPIAHYAGSSITLHQSTGWIDQGAALPTDPATGCNASCNTLWQFPPDPTKSTFNQNQMLLPVPVGATTFTPSGNFGVFSGDANSVNFTDDSLNLDHVKGSNPVANVPIPHYLHAIRVYQAYGPGHVAIPNTFIVGDDIVRVSASKNNDFQDVLLLLRNATPAVSYGPQPGAATTANLTTGGTVSPTCAVTGFDGVMPNTAGDQCLPGNLSFNASWAADDEHRRTAGQRRPAERAVQDVRRDQGSVHRDRAGGRAGQLPRQRLPAGGCVLRPGPGQLRQGRGRAHRLTAPHDVLPGQGRGLDDRHRWRCRQ